MYEQGISDPDSRARTGVLTTRHGKISTPAFMPVATKATVKTLTSRDLEDLGVQSIISNAFLLSLRPGEPVISEHGGLHRFMNWKRPLFTDSGGFQVLNPELCLDISIKGVKFRSPYDGSVSVLTPELSASFQSKIKSDAAMVLDDCPPVDSPGQRMRDAVERTLAWAKRYKDQHETVEIGVAAFEMGQLVQQCQSKFFG